MLCSSAYVNAGLINTVCELSASFVIKMHGAKLCNCTDLFIFLFHPRLVLYICLPPFGVSTDVADVHGGFTSLLENASHLGT
jgi:hypothetical protein